MQASPNLIGGREAPAHAPRNADSLAPQVYTVPAEIDREVARLKLEALGVHLEPMTEEQARYVTSWQEGT